jgi:hypothetical protein
VSTYIFFVKADKESLPLTFKVSIIYSNSTSDYTAIFGKSGYKLEINALTDPNLIN